MLAVTKPTLAEVQHCINETANELHAMWDQRSLDIAVAYPDPVATSKEYVRHQAHLEGRLSDLWDQKRRLLARKK